MSKPTLIILGEAWSATQRPVRQTVNTIVVGKSTMRINVRLAKAMDIKNGERLLLAQDESMPKDFYLMCHEQGFPCSVNKRSGETTFSNSLYLRLLQKALELPAADRFKFKVSSIPDSINGEECWAINTVNPLLPLIPAAATGEKAPVKEELFKASKNMMLVD